MAIALPVSQPSVSAPALARPLTRMHAAPRTRGTAMLGALVAAFVATPWLIRPLEAWLAPAEVALFGQVAESLLGVALGTWMFRLIRRQAAIARQHAREIERLTESDPLTGLGNRRALARELELALNRARRTREPIALLYLDLDAPRDDGRRRGRALESQALRMLGAVVRSSVRFGSDAGYRIGEGTLALVLAADREAAQAVCRRLEWNFRERTPHAGPLGVGVASWDGRATPERLIDEARQALAVQRQTAMVAEMA